MFSYLDAKTPNGFDGNETRLLMSLQNDTIGCGVSADDTIGNNNSGTETIRIELDYTASDSPNYLLDSLQLQTTQFNGQTIIGYRITNGSLVVENTSDVNASAPGSGVVVQQSSPYQFISIDLPSASIDSSQLLVIELFAANQSFKLVDFNLGLTEIVDPVDYGFDFTVAVSDSDLDTTSSSFSVDVDVDAVSLPIAIDLSGDGVIGYLTRDEGVTFDFDSDGSKESTPWVAPEDGLLAYDADQDGRITMSQELSFVSYHPDAKSDLEGLSLAFDTNNDGLLDSHDQAYADFGVWQDLNSDGITDPGEYHSLAELGVQSIRLESDGLVDSAADGQVQVLGSTELTYDDGTTAIAQDVAFVTLIDQVISDPTVLDSVSAPPDLIAPTVDPGTTDLSLAVDAFLALEPVTDGHLAAYTEDVNLGSDVNSQDISAIADPAFDGTTTSIDTSVVDTSHDAPAYDPIHDSAVPDSPTYDHVV